MKILSTSSGTWKISNLVFLRTLIYFWITSYTWCSFSIMTSGACLICSKRYSSLLEGEGRYGSVYVSMFFFFYIFAPTVVALLRIWNARCVQEKDSDPRQMRSLCPLAQRAALPFDFLTVKKTTKWKQYAILLLPFLDVEHSLHNAKNNSHQRKHVLPDFPSLFSFIPEYLAIFLIMWKRNCCLTLVRTRVSD